MYFTNLRKKSTSGTFLTRHESSRTEAEHEKYNSCNTEARPATKNDIVSFFVEAGTQKFLQQ